MTTTRATLSTVAATSDIRETIGPVAEVPLADLHPHPRNPRKITPQRLEQLKRNLAADRDMLTVRPLIALPDGTVIAGNQRLRAALALGWDTIPTVHVDLDEQRATLWALRDNRGFGEDDEDAVAILLEELSKSGVDVELSGYSTSEIASLLAAANAQPDVEPPPLDKFAPVTCPACGEVFDRS